MASGLNMDREIEFDERDRMDPLARERAEECRPSLENARLARAREPVRDGRRVYRISDAERQTLFEIGRFRTVAVQDLLKLRYRGDAARLEDDFRSLSAQGLIRRRSASIAKGKALLDVVVTPDVNEWTVSSMRWSSACARALLIDVESATSNDCSPASTAGSSAPTIARYDSSWATARS